MAQEAHLLHQFDGDFYDEELTLLLCGYLRQEADFSSLGEWKAKERNA